MITKLLCIALVSLAIPVQARSQGTQLQCTAPGSPGAQLEAVRRLGVGPAYALTAVITADLPDSTGHVSTGTISSFQARDMQGRTRVDMPTLCAVDRGGNTHWGGLITVTDPTMNTRIVWRVNPDSRDPRNNVASVVTDPAGVGPVNEPRTGQDEYLAALKLSKASEHDEDADKHIHRKVEDLGKRTFVGLQATGMLTTKTYPVGSIGNVAAIVETEERWTSDQYRVILFDKKTNSLLGSSTYEVTKFTPNNIDESLFLPPAGYTLKTQ